MKFQKKINYNSKLKLTIKAAIRRRTGQATKGRSTEGRSIGRQCVSSSLGIIIASIKIFNN
jgi:hypothetical protein